MQEGEYTVARLGSSGEGVQTSQKRITGALLVRVRRTLRCKRLGCYELVAATEEDSHNSYYRFTI